MVETKLIPVLLLLAAAGCAPQMKWEKFSMDGHRTGTAVVTADNMEESLGCLDDSVYVSPSGARFDSGSTLAAARLLFGVQPRMAYLKRVIGYSPVVMKKSRPECALCNWAVDGLMAGVRTATGKPVDLGIINFGGIRVDMPEGDVMLDDIRSMFPFRNCLSYVRLKGSDVRAVLEQMASGKVEALGGVRVEIEGSRLVSAMIGGEPLDDNRSYGLATIDFLLDGGDGFKLARNAEELIITDINFGDWMMMYVCGLTSEGRNIEGKIDGRVVIK